jgi:hypothetical protein
VSRLVYSIGHMPVSFRYCGSLVSRIIKIHSKMRASRSWIEFAGIPTKISQRRSDRQSLADQVIEGESIMD